MKTKKKDHSWIYFFGFAGVASGAVGIIPLWYCFLHSAMVVLFWIFRDHIKP